MGLFDRFARGANAVVEPVDRALDWSDKGMARTAEIVASGDDAVGRIVGLLHVKEHQEDSSERVLTLGVAVPASDGSVQRHGIEVANHVAHRLRLGMDVLVRTDGSTAALSWDAMCERWGVSPGDAFQRSRRTAPADGIEDKAIDFGVQRRLKKGAPDNATILELRQKRVLGIATENWEFDLRLSDGTVATTRSEVVPRYAAWYAAPGAEVVVRVDTGDRSKATVDWAAVALREAPTARFDEVPREGSIAASIEAAWGPGSEAAASVVGAADAAGGPAAAADVALDATLQAWVGLVRSGRMKPRQFEKSLADWQAAGMCTPAQADAARRAVT